MPNDSVLGWNPDASGLGFGLGLVPMLGNPSRLVLLSMMFKAGLCLDALGEQGMHADLCGRKGLRGGPSLDCPWLFAAPKCLLMLEKEIRLCFVASWLHGVWNDFLRVMSCSLVRSLVPVNRVLWGYLTMMVRIFFEGLGPFPPLVEIRDKLSVKFHDPGFGRSFGYYFSWLVFNSCC